MAVEIIRAWSLAEFVTTNMDVVFNTHGGLDVNRMLIIYKGSSVLQTMVMFVGCFSSNYLLGCMAS